MNTTTQPTIMGEIIGDATNTNSMDENIQYLESNKSKAIEEIMLNPDMSEEQKKSIISYLEKTTISTQAPASFNNNLLNELKTEAILS
jgi:hypothetical protein